MIDNNLDFDVALYPYELVTYGETGQVCQNWMQYRLIKRYLEVLTREQTLVMASGHPVGLFASSPEAPRVIITNALMVGCFDDQENWHRATALGVANYGQMTAGGWMYIGPQGIVHGTYSTILNAGRAKLGIPADQDLAGRLFVTSGLGGMSGAQGKAVVIANGVGLIAEVDHSRIQTRLDQGWIDRVTDSPAEAFAVAREFQRKQQGIAIAFHGNVVDLLEHAVHHHVPIDLLSDQTSCHAVYEGGYCPQGISFEERTELLRSGQAGFKEMVNATLRHHYDAHQDPLRARHLLFRLRQQLSQGGLRRRDQGHLQKRREPAGRVHLPVLRRRHHGAAALRLRLRSVSLGVPERPGRGSGRDRPGRHGVHRPASAGSRTATTTIGSAMP